MDDDLEAKGIEELLTGRFGRPLMVVDETGSTNADALDWANKGAPEGAVVVADHQTAGRGRRGRPWLSEPRRSLLFSVVLRPQLQLELTGLLSLALGVACADGIESESSLAVKLRWPNDITFAGRKLAGILVESRTKVSSLDAVVAGIGINVDWPRDELSSMTGREATSLSAELGRVPRRDRLLASLLRHIEFVYELVRTSPDEVVTRATARSDVLGRMVRIRFADGRELDGTATGIAPSGALELDADGVRHEVRVGEVERLM